MFVPISEYIIAQKNLLSNSSTLNQNKLQAVACFGSPIQQQF